MLALYLGIIKTNNMTTYNNVKDGVTAEVTKIDNLFKVTVYVWAMSPIKATFATRDEVRACLTSWGIDMELRNYAKEDVEMLQAEGAMAITNTKLGVLWLTVEDYVMIARDGLGNVLFQTAEDNLMIAFIADNYITQ